MKRAYLLTLLAIICNTIFAQTEWTCLGDATVELKKQLGEDNIFRYTVKIPQTSSFASSITPDLEAFYVESGPLTSSSSNYQVQNGKITNTSSVTYTWLLTPKMAGICQIPSFMIKNEKTKEYYNVESATISASSYKGKGNTHKRRPIVSGDSNSRAKDIILRWKTPKVQLSVGETLHCHIELLAGPSVSMISDIKRFTPDDAYTSVIDTTNTYTSCDTIVNGKKYYYCIIKNIDVIPLKAGHLALPECSAELTYYNHQDYDPFEAFFNGATIPDTTISVRVPAVNLTVKPRKIYAAPVDIEHSGIAVCCDVSSSMQFKDNGITRINIAQEFIRRLKVNEDMQASYMAFANKKEYGWCKDIMQYLDTIKQPVNDGTAIHDAFAYPIASLKKCKDVIVITDGLDNGSHISAKTMIDLLREYEVRPHLVYINSMSDSLGYDLYISPDTLEDGTITEGHYELQTVKNDKLTPQEIAEWQSMLRQLGGDIYCIKSKDDINSAIALIMNNVCKNSDTASRRLGTTTAAYHYILNKLKTDF